MKNLLLFLFISLVYLHSVHAQVINIPEDYSSIQQGIHAAQNGDTIMVDTGTYVERINFTGKNIVVTSKYINTLDSNYMYQTIIDGDALESVVSIVSGEDSNTLLYGFTIQNGADSIGGGIRIIGSSPKVKSCIIKNNRATYAGGGIYCINSNPEIRNCIIEKNITDNNDYNVFGGGVCMQFSGGIISNSIIIDNDAIGYPGFGGGIHTDNGTTNFSEIHISGNHAIFGGGLSNWSEYSVFNQLEIKQNDANLGAGIFDWGGGRIYNSIITNNIGLAIESWGTSYVINCTLIDNSRGIYVRAENFNAYVYIFNSIVRNNGVYDLRATGGQYSHAYINLNNCNIDSSNVEFGGHGHINWIAGNIDQEPLFENQYGSEYYPSNESPCANAGTPDTTGLHIPAFDFVGNPRFFGNRIDIGALENQEVKGIINIPEDYATIQQGIDASYDRDTVLVDTGTYVERINFNGKNIVVASKYVTTLDTNYINQTIIDGDSLGSVVSIVSGEDSTAMLCGFTVQNGASDKGGGIYINGADPALDHLIVKNNDASKYGGGVYINNSDAAITNSTIKGNNIYPQTDYSAGGGIYCNNSNPNIRYVTIENNTIFAADHNCSSSGGGIIIYSCGGALKNTKILNNSAFAKNSDAWGGGLSFGTSTTTLTDLNIEENYSDLYGGGISFGSGSTSIKNVNVINNSAIVGGGIYINLDSEDSIVFQNIDVKSNSAALGGGIANITANSITSFTTFVSSLFENNHAAGSGGGAFCLGYSTLFTNCTLTMNSGGDGGLYISIKSKVYLTNTILSNNTPYEMYIQYHEPGEVQGEAYLSFCNLNPNSVGGSTTGVNYLIGNINDEPSFENHFGFEYYPSNSSPCVNAGTPDTTGLNLPEFDLAGNPRIYGNRIDMGALENQEVWSGISDITEDIYKIKVHPNPVTDQLSIEYSLDKPNSVTIVLKNLQGQYSKQLLSELKMKGHHSLTYNCEQLPPGIYFIHFQINDQEFIRKVVKM